MSQGCRLVLLRHVPSSMPLHLLSVLNTPKTVFKKIQGIFSSFSEVNLKRKEKNGRFERSCVPIEEGGIRVRTISNI